MVGVGRGHGVVDNWSDGSVGSVGDGRTHTFTHKQTNNPNPKPKTHLSRVEDADAVVVGEREDAVRDGQERGALELRADGRLDQPVRLGVDCCWFFVVVF